MEFLDERSRFEHGCLSRETQATLAVFAMQALLLLEGLENGQIEEQ